MHTHKYTRTHTYTHTQTQPHTHTTTHIHNHTHTHTTINIPTFFHIFSSSSQHISFFFPYTNLTFSLKTRIAVGTKDC